MPTNLKRNIMKQLFLLFSHKPTPAQESDAKESLGVTHFVTLPEKLQNLWSNIPPTLENLSDYLTPLKEYITNKSQEGDIVLIQGDFGGCYEMVNFVKSLGLKAVYATTKRDVVEKEIDGKMVKTSVFEHVRFREF